MMKYQLVLLFFAQAMSMHAHEVDCLYELKKRYDYHQGWFIGNTVLSLIPPVTLFTAPNIAFNKRAAVNYLRSLRIVEQAHYKKTHTSNAPQLLWLVNMLKQKNPAIKKHQVKTVIKLMAQNMNGVCGSPTGDYHRYLKKFRKRNLINSVYDDVVKKYDIPAGIAEDDEETSQENFDEDLPIN